MSDAAPLGYRVGHILNHNPQVTTPESVTPWTLLLALLRKGGSGKLAFDLVDSRGNIATNVTAVPMYNCSYLRYIPRLDVLASLLEALSNYGVPIMPDRPILVVGMYSVWLHFACICCVSRCSHFQISNIQGHLTIRLQSAATINYFMMLLN